MKETSILSYTIFMNYLTLRELTHIIKSTVDSNLRDEYWVTAELSQISCHHNSGHCYMEIVERQDNSTAAKMRAVIWARDFRQISVNFLNLTGQELQAGMKILMLARVAYHEVHGLSLNVKDIDPRYTLGEMALKRKEIIERLTKEGIIDKNRSLPLPAMLQNIAVISSASAAGYGDFINRLDNNPYGYKFSHKLFHSYVQGERAEESILNALKQCKRYENYLDAVVIIRGGGSTFDLYCFDSYLLAKEIALFPLPVFTGIGHQRDETVADRVANKRLITPTAVAEFIISMALNFENRINDLRKRLIARTDKLISDERNHLKLNTNTLLSASKQCLVTHRNWLSQTTNSFNHIAIQKIGMHKHRIEGIHGEIGHKTEKYLTQFKADISNLAESLRGHSKHFLRATTNFLRLNMQSLRTGTISAIKAPSFRLREYEGKLYHRSKWILWTKYKNIDEHIKSLRIHVKHILSKSSDSLRSIDAQVKLLNPKNVLNRGYSITLFNGKALKDVSSIKKGDIIDTVLFKGNIKSVIKNIKEEEDS